MKRKRFTESQILNILKEAEAVVGDWGFSKIELSVWSENTEAKKAFQRSGFKTYSEKMGMEIDSGRQQ